MVSLCQDATLRSDGTGTFAQNWSPNMPKSDKHRPCRCDRCQGPLPGFLRHWAAPTACVAVALIRELLK